MKYQRVRCTMWLLCLAVMCTLCKQWSEPQLCVVTCKPLWKWYIWKCSEVNCIPGQDKERKEGNEVSHPFWEWLLAADQRSTLMMDISRKAAKCLECTAQKVHYFSLLSFPPSFSLKQLASLTWMFNPAFRCAPLCGQHHRNGRCGIYPMLCNRGKWLLTV